MTRVIVSPQARIDLLTIIARLAAVAGSVTADKWDRKLWKAINGLAQFPGSGAPRSTLGDHTRIVTVRPYIVIYEHVRGSGVVEVLRVVHGRRKVTMAMSANKWADPPHLTDTTDPRDPADYVQSPNVPLC